MKRLFFKYYFYTRELLGFPISLVHSRCGELVSFKNVLRGYFAQCPDCCEDLYSFEVEEVK